ncbi:efflux RND transporter permease subunit [Methylobacterium sp. NEAU K]|uniref:efflux RND transporter permease subunit n=1 Tax=Methylobacterium sp. NEAU K TaxID=3064946 RepID=UPI0027346E2C|nr:efflux RND transporter permease subunit [Methylobacterium sp. NEAU K]MDP4002709.1 efflux RND transporter permease subunit [Methylobacterium sp. NEAU K]
MGLVQYALKFRVSFYVLAVLMVLAGIGSIIMAPKDVLPSVNIPVVVVVWTYNGLSPTETGQRITTYSEFSISNNVNNIKRMESTTLQGVAIEKIYFDETVSIDLAISQVVSATNSVRALMPPGVQPPVIMRFSASSVPVIQLALTSTKDTLTKVYDYAQYRIRQTLVQVPGSTLPPPYGGAPRQVMVDLNLHALQAVGLTPLDVTNAVLAQNLTVPSGLAKIGEQQYPVHLNAAPEVIDTLNRIPVKVVDGHQILMRDVAYVRDGSPPKLNIIRSDGQHSVLMQVLKNGNASTLDVVNHVKEMLPAIKAAAPEGMTIRTLFDQSVFVSAAIENVVHEAVLASSLTGLTILLFLGSWRSTLVVLISIPLCILTSLAVLTALGESINVMTLGGLALSVGILVDDATVAVENTYRLFEEGKDFYTSVIEGASGIAKPALISTLSICAAFVAVFALADTPKYLFTPQALAVVFAMLTSYFLSRTLVPVLIDVLVKPEFRQRHGEILMPDGRTWSPRDEWKFSLRARRRAAAASRLFSPLVRAAAAFRATFERGFARFHASYVRFLTAVLTHRLATGATALGVLALGGTLMPFVGQDYFPQIQASQMTLHVRTRPGMRLETAEKTFAKVEATIREIIPEDELGLILDNIGLPAMNYNFAFSDGSFVAYNDGQMLINLKGEHRPISHYMKVIREQLAERFPDTVFYFQPSDIITQILNFGTIAQIDIQVAGRDTAKDYAASRRIERRLKQVPGAVDVHIHQIMNVPELFVDVDRGLASELNVTEQQIAQSMTVSLSGSYQVSPNFWVDPKNGIPYQLWVQTPEWRNDSMTALSNTPIFVQASGHNETGSLTLLSSVATFHRQPTQSVINHVNTQPTFDVLANVQGTDLASVRDALAKIVAEEQTTLPPPDKIVVRGQIESMASAFGRLEVGLAIAIAAVYLLMAVNFQGWGDPFVILLALPVAFCGIVLSLFATGTTFSIPSLFGAIMSVGVASANSILLVTFAREYREATGCSAHDAALKAGEIRLRPVLMTAGAMFLGLIPMALGSGEGGEQNAALARAVMGGIGAATGSTLLLVPFLYALMRQAPVQPLRNFVSRGSDARA